MAFEFGICNHSLVLKVLNDHLDLVGVEYRKAVGSLLKPNSNPVPLRIDLFIPLGIRKRVTKVEDNIDAIQRPVQVSQEIGGKIESMGLIREEV